MGYVRHKYTKTYFLKEDSTGNPTIYGAEGVEDFEKGGIREHDRGILERLDLNGKIVLDLGFGRGEAIKFAADKGAGKVVGVDFSEDAHTIAQEFLDGHGVHADLYCADALSFLKSCTAREDGEVFDIVLMLDFVEHVPRSELTEILKLMRKALSARAVVAINTPIFRVDNDVIAGGLDPAARDTSDDFEETAGMHCNRYTKKSLQGYMSNCGFRAISGHFFVPSLSIPESLAGSRWAWCKAFRMGYPILLSGLWHRERFEHAFSWEEIRRRRNRPIQRVLRFGIHVMKAMLRRIDFPRTHDKGESAAQWVRIGGGPLEGYYLLLDLNSPAYWHREMMGGRYDSFMYEALDQYGNIEGTTIWDVGAHIGYHSLAFAALVGPSGHVVAFEPNPYNVARLRQNFEKNPELAERVTVMTCALSNVDGDAQFVLSSEVDDGRSSGSHLDTAVVPEDQVAYRSFSQTTVSTVRADTLLRARRVPLPSIIKIDVEGAEKTVLEGAVELFSVQKPLLFLEIHNITMMFYVQKLLTDLGYEMRILDTELASPSRCFVMAKPNGQADREVMSGPLARNMTATQ